MSSNEDDTEVANSFRNNDLTNKISFPILQVPPLFQSHVSIYFPIPSILFLCLFSKYLSEIFSVEY
jgi:hypothetical protein